LNCSAIRQKKIEKSRRGAHVQSHPPNVQRGDHPGCHRGKRRAHSVRFFGTVTDDAINGCRGLVACGAVSGSFSFDSGAVDGNAAGGAGYTRRAQSASLAQSTNSGE
jgi:hypothetical protein